MKTTVNIKDELLRRAKSQAALRGQSFGGFLEGALTRALEEGVHADRSMAEWARALPVVSEEAVVELNAVFVNPAFRLVEQEMWA